MRTYTQYVTERRELVLSSQALVMGVFFLNGRVLAVRDIADEIDVPNGTVAGVCHVLRSKGFLERQRRGVYRLTRLGRSVFEGTVERTLGRRR